MIDTDRLLKQIEKLGEIDWDKEKRIDHLSSSTKYLKAKVHVRVLAAAAGMKTRVDEVESFLGKYESLALKKEKILSESKLDTTSEGERRDGPLGITGAIEVTRTLQGPRNNHHLEAVASIAEEAE